jgi:peptidyl-tRNA hydrolase
VLGRFTRAESEEVEAVVENVASALETALRSGVTRAMELYNRPGSLGCEELR